MNNVIRFISLLFCGLNASAQSFAPAAGEPGSTAIPKDSSCFVAWADNATIYRGYIDINDTTATFDGSNRATFGEIANALGAAQGSTANVISLGDSGHITLTFPMIVQDGPGFDFAVFENGFMDHYMELAHVEVSSDGVHFFRFPSTSEIPLEEQQTNFSTSDCGYVNNLAGKYRIGFGTPFDLSEVMDDVLLNKQAVTHIRIVDAIGAITGTGTTDQYGTTINDPYPTPFTSGGFDLDGVGIINGTVGLNENAQLAVALWPNPSKGTLNIQLSEPARLVLINTCGQTVLDRLIATNESIDLKAAGIANGVYQVILQTDEGFHTERLIVEE